MITLENISLTFGKDTPLETRALKKVDLEVPAGQFVTVIGSNGAGKSTFLNVVAGAFFPDTGSIVVDGKDITKLPTHKRADQISRVFQDPKMGTCEDLTILENFALALGRTQPKGFRFAIDKGLRERVAEQVKALNLGLENRLNDTVGLLSGGQRQAVSLLMATIGETKVLLLDEHTAALDPTIAEFVIDLTKQVVEEDQLTTLMVTHSMQQALSVGERTIMFHRGEIVLDIDGEERANMDVAGLLKKFKDHEGEELADDSLLMG